MLVLLATIPTSASPSNSEPAGLAAVARLQSIVEESTACSLPGVSVKYDTFIPCMWQAVSRGFVKHAHAVFVGEGLRDGFTAGIDVTRLRGHRWFSNYKSAVEGREAVTRATMKRVDAGKTVQIGTWTDQLASALRNSFSASAIFPGGCSLQAARAY